MYIPHDMTEAMLYVISNEARDRGEKVQIPG